MRMAQLVTLILIPLLAVACSNDDKEEIRDQTNTSQQAPEVYPKAKGDWIEARIFMMESEDESQDCAQVDFRVMANSGIFSVSECDSIKTGQLTAEEFTELDRVATKAYSETESAVCPEIFRFNKYYASVNAPNDELDRNFDPDSSCYRGSESVVTTYKNNLRQLLAKYRSQNRTAEEE